MAITSQQTEDKTMDTKILPLHVIKDYLSDKRLYVVAKETGLSYPTLRKLADGVETNYTLNTMRAISEYIYSRNINTESK